MKCLSVGAEWVHEDTEKYTDGRTDITKTLVVFRNSENAPINEWRREGKQKVLKLGVGRELNSKPRTFIGFQNNEYLEYMKN